MNQAAQTYWGCASLLAPCASLLAPAQIYWPLSSSPIVPPHLDAVKGKLSRRDTALLPFHDG